MAKPTPNGDPFDKKAPSLRVQNVLKYIISQNPNGALAKSQHLVTSPPSLSVHSAPATPVKRSTQASDTKLMSALTLSPQLTKVLSPLKALVMSATPEVSNVQAPSARVVSGNKESVNKESGTEKDNSKMPGIHAGLECEELLDASPVKNKTSSEPLKIDQVDLPMEAPMEAQTDITTQKTSRSLPANADKAALSAVPLELAKEDVSDSVPNTLEPLLAKDTLEPLLGNDKPSATQDSSIDDTKGMTLDECPPSKLDEPVPCTQNDVPDISIEGKPKDLNTDEGKRQDVNVVEQNESKVFDTPSELGAEVKQGTGSSMSIVEAGSTLNPTEQHTRSSPPPTHPVGIPDTESSQQPHTPGDQSTNNKSSELGPTKPSSPSSTTVVTSILNTDTIPSSTKLPHPVCIAPSVTTTTLSTLPVIETRTEPVLSVSEIRKRPASIDSLVDVTPAKKQALSTTFQVSHIPLPLTERMIIPLSLTKEKDTPISQTEDKAVTSTETGVNKSESALKSIAEALVSPTVIPDTGSLLQSLCTADPYSLEESELASELGLDSVDPLLLNLSGFMDIIQLPGTPTTPISIDVPPQMPTISMNIDVPPQTPTIPMNSGVPPQTPTIPMNIGVPPQTPIIPMDIDVAPQTPIISMNVDVPPQTPIMNVDVPPQTPTMNVNVPPILSGTPTAPMNIDAAPLCCQTIDMSEPVSHVSVSTVRSSEAAVTMSVSSPPGGLSVAPTVTTPFPSIVPPQLQLLPLSAPRSQGTMVPIVAHQHFSPNLATPGSPILSTRPSLLQQPDLPVTLFYQTSTPGNTVVSPLSTFPQLQSGVSFVTSSGQQPLLATAVTPEVIIALPLGPNDPSLMSPFSASGKEDGGIGTRLSAKQDVVTGVVQTPLSQPAHPQPLPITPLTFGPPQEKSVRVSTDMALPVQHATIGDLFPQQVTQNPSPTTADPNIFPLPINQSGLDITSRRMPEEGQPISTGVTPLASKDPDVVQLTPRDVDLLQRLTLGGTDIGDIVGDVNERELLEGIPLDLAATIQAIARIDEQDSVPWK